MSIAGMLGFPTQYEKRALYAIALILDKLTQKGVFTQEEMMEIVNEFGDDDKTNKFFELGWKENKKQEDIPDRGRTVRG